MHAEKCPVCDGKGTLPDYSAYSTFTAEVMCHGCNGLGWVQVSDIYDVYPVTPYVPPWHPETDDTGLSTLY